MHAVKQQAGVAWQLETQGWRVRADTETEKLFRAAKTWADKRKKPKEKQIGLRLEEDLIFLGKHRAAQEGFTGYQSLMKRVFYRCLMGKLMDPELEELRSAKNRKAG